MMVLAISILLTLAGVVSQIFALGGMIAYGQRKDGGTMLIATALGLIAPFLFYVAGAM